MNLPKPVAILARLLVCNVYTGCHFSCYHFKSTVISWGIKNDAHIFSVPGKIREMGKFDSHFI